MSASHDQIHAVRGGTRVHTTQINVVYEGIEPVVQRWDADPTNGPPMPAPFQSGNAKRLRAVHLPTAAGPTPLQQPVLR